LLQTCRSYGAKFANSFICMAFTLAPELALAKWFNIDNQRIIIYLTNNS